MIIDIIGLLTEEVIEINNKVLIIGIVILALVLGGMAVLSNKPKANPPQPVQTQTPAQTSVSEAPNNSAVKEVVVTVTKNGFQPQTVTVKVGNRITWVNKTGTTTTVNSDDHPTHLLYRDLNLGPFPNDSSIQVVLTKLGKYTYHDHLNPNRTGTIVVE